MKINIICLLLMSCYLVACSTTGNTGPVERSQQPSIVDINRAKLEKSMVF